MRVARRYLWLFLVSGVLFGAGQTLPAYGQDLPDDLSQLSLEELMQIDVIPVDVLGGHIHSKGEWMVGFRTMFMQMREVSHGHDAGPAEGHHSGHGDAHEDGHGDEPGDGYMVTPTDMRMEMHMAEIMYGVTNRLTMMVMLPFERLSMDHQTRTGEHFTTASAGVGDVSIAAHYALKRSAKNYWVALLGMSLPTGSINRRDETPMGTDQVLPYPMQIGSGTPDLLTGITYIHQRTAWSWGFHADGKVRLGRNTHQYRLGHEYHVGVWVTRRVTEWFAPTLHVDGHRTGDVRGADPALNPSMVPTADPTLQGDTHLSVVPILNFHIPRGFLENHRFTLQGSFPIHHPHTGIPLETTAQVMIAWQWTL